MKVEQEEKSIKTAAIIVAGGSGQRMNNAIPKQFLLLKEKPILYYCIQSFLQALPSIKIILVLPESQLSYANIILQYFDERIDLTIVTGGTTRYHSVQHGVAALSDEDIVFVHDGVRPFVSEKMIIEAKEIAQEKGIAIPCIPVTDSIRMIKDTSSEVVNRDALRAIQTPQVFKGNIIKKIFQQAYQASFTDEATVAENCGFAITLFTGEKNNFKITTPEDLHWAEAIFEQNQQVK